MQGTRKQRGITLIETAAVSAVLAVAAGSAVPSFSKVLERRAVEGTATQLATDLYYVRSQAVARNESVRISFGAAGAEGCYVIHTGAADECTCAPNGPAVCSGAAEELKTVLLPASGRVRVQSNTASMLFHPVRGTTTPAGTLRVIGAQGQEVRHVVNIMGRVRSCSPEATIKGYPAC